MSSDGVITVLGRPGAPLENVELPLHLAFGVVDIDLGAFEHATRGGHRGLLLLHVDLEEYWVNADQYLALADHVAHVDQHVLHPARDLRPDTCGLSGAQSPDGGGKTAERLAADFHPL